MTGLVTRPDVSIITVNWNTGEMTARAVKSIYDHARGVTFELIAVDKLLDVIPTRPAARAARPAVRRRRRERVPRWPVRGPDGLPPEAS